MAAMPYPSEPFTIGDYLLKSKLRDSSVSIVWKAETKSSGEEVAVKQVFLSKLNKHLADCLDFELNFLSSVNHPNIIRLLHVLQVCSFIWLSLFSFLFFSFFDSNSWLFMIFRSFLEYPFDIFSLIPRFDGLTDSISLCQLEYLVVLWRLLGTGQFISQFQSF